MKIILIFQVVIFILFSCSKSEISPEELEKCIEENIAVNQDDEAYIEFQANYSKWKCLDIKHYSIIHIGHANQCTESQTYIEVKNGEIIDTSLIDSGLSSSFCIYNPLEYYFDLILAAVDRSIFIESPVILNALNEPLPAAHKVDIVYDQEYGIPLEGYIDYIFGLADEEIQFEFRDFKVIE